MPLDPFNIPTLNDVFGSHTKLMGAFAKAGITDITPAMILPEGSLMTLEDIGPRTEKRITELLRKAGIERRIYPQKLAGYLDQQFGRISDAPASSLQVQVVRDGEANYPLYAPLEVIALLDSQNPHLTVMDIVSTGSRGLEYVVHGSGHPEDLPEPAVHNVHQDILHLRWRLDYLGLQLGNPGRKTRGGFDLQAPAQLHAV